MWPELYRWTMTARLNQALQHKKKPGFLDQADRIEQTLCFAALCFDGDCRLGRILGRPIRMLDAIFEARIEGFLVQFFESRRNRIEDRCRKASGVSTFETAAKKPTITMFSTIFLPSSSAMRVAGSCRRVSRRARSNAHQVLLDDEHAVRLHFRRKLCTPPAT